VIGKAPGFFGAAKFKSLGAKICNIRRSYNITICCRVKMQ